MSEIPEDIMQTASKLLDTLQWDIDSADADRERIALAILAERERCAAIADARADAYAEIANKHDGTLIGESNTMRCGAAAAIADAIRGQP